MKTTRSEEEVNDVVVTITTCSGAHMRQRALQQDLMNQTNTKRLICTRSWVWSETRETHRTGDGKEVSQNTRSCLCLQTKYTTYNYLNITWAPYGPHRRQGRKIYLSELFSSKRLESYEYIRVEELRAFVSCLYALSGKPVLLKEHLSRVTLSIMSRIVLGKKYFSESEFETAFVTLEEFQEMFDELFLLNGVLNIGDWIP
ncbi:hypothetical protein LWI29_038324 [Acer saccharum]|uniref:Uncharacterized protein n=1 Tax=Acer saccharum TaxID=4024 RepID=A0AA39VKR9_ACESA|nr:hypothetical protein LWI29_038324 [Acer saccharum]